MAAPAARGLGWVGIGVEVAARVLEFEEEAHLNVPGSWTRAAGVAVALVAVCGVVSIARAGAPDSLMLRAPGDVIVSTNYQGNQQFLNYITWDDIPDNVGTLIEPPTPWALNTTPTQLLSVVATTGAYNSDIDRTVVFTAQDSGMVGVDEILIEYFVRLEGSISGRITLSTNYVPGTFLPVRFSAGTIDYGMQVSFGSGRIDQFSTFSVGMQDFEGFHIWRGIEANGSDLTIIGELSKQEAFVGNAPGGSIIDSLYFYEIVPTLRQGRPWISPFGAIECVGTRFDLDLEADEYFWWDCEASNGFIYYYAVTTFDRGYIASSSQQGLTKVDHCPVSGGVPFPCPDELHEVPMEVNAQNDLYNVYVVPNPYRSGGSRLTASNYHNFPDDVVRFVNIPTDCTIKVFTVAGDLVWENVQSASNSGGGNVEWDLTNRSGDAVTSGVYIYRVESSNGDQVFGRIVVIR